MLPDAGSEIFHFVGEPRERGLIAFGKLVNSTSERQREPVNLALH